MFGASYAVAYASPVEALRCADGEAFRTDAIPDPADYEAIKTILKTYLVSHVAYVYPYPALRLLSLGCALLGLPVLQRRLHVRNLLGDAVCLSPPDLATVERPTSVDIVLVGGLPDRRGVLQCGSGRLPQLCRRRSVPQQLMSRPQQHRVLSNHSGRRSVTLQQASFQLSESHTHSWTHHLSTIG